MIKINLLPVKRAAKKTKTPADEAMMQLGIGLGVTLIFLGACGYRWQMLVDEVTLQTQAKETKTKEIGERPFLAVSASSRLNPRSCWMRSE